MSAAPGPPAGARIRLDGAALIRYWLPAAAYVAVIFSVSSIPGKDIPSGFPNMDKCAHLLEYSLLGLLLGRAIRFTMEGWPRKAAAIATIVFGALIGVADEIYQRRIPGRQSDIRDWMVDVLAISAAVAFTQWASARSLRKRAAGAAAAMPEERKR